MFSSFIIATYTNLKYGYILSQHPQFKNFCFISIIFTVYVIFCFHVFFSDCDCCNVYKIIPKKLEFTIYFFIFSGRPLSVVCNRTVNFRDIFNGHFSNWIFITLKPSCTSLAMPNILRCLFASWWSTVGNYPNIW